MFEFHFLFSSTFVNIYKFARILAMKLSRQRELLKTKYCIGLSTISVTELHINIRSLIIVSERIIKGEASHCVK